MNNEIKQITHIVRQWASTIPYGIKVYLFGSCINSTQKPNSDIDIALEFTNNDEVPDKTIMWFRLHTYWNLQLSRLLTRVPHLCLYEDYASPEAKDDTQQKNFLTTKKYRLIYETSENQSEKAR